MQKMAGPFMENQEINKISEQIGFAYTCKSADQCSVTYNQELFESSDAVTKELALQHYLLSNLVGEPYDAKNESFQIKFIRELQAKNGFK